MTERKRGHGRDHFRMRKQQSPGTAWPVQGRVRMTRAAGEWQDVAEKTERFEAWSWRALNAVLRNTGLILKTEESY